MENNQLFKEIQSVYQIFNLLTEKEKGITQRDIKKIGGIKDKKTLNETLKKMITNKWLIRKNYDKSLNTYPQLQKAKFIYLTTEKGQFVQKEIIDSYLKIYTAIYTSD